MTRPGEEVFGPLSHRLFWLPGVVQQVCPAGVLDLGPGYLDPGLLPVDLLRDAYAGALAEFGSAALAYGDDQGALALRSLLAHRTAEAEDRRCAPERILLTAGTSHALYLVGTMLAARGDVVLVDERCYDLGRRILVDCGLRTRSIPMDTSGMEPEALRDAIAAERRRNGKVAFAYVNPTFHNPTGMVMPAGRRQELLAVAARQGVLVVEDDAYAELELESPGAPCSMAGLAGYEGVVRLRTFSKTLAPGLRLGWLMGEPAVIDRLAGHGLFASGGSANHLASLAVTRLLRIGDYDRHLGRLRNALRERRDALAGALRDQIAEEIEFHVPAGGYFLWLRFPRNADEAGLVAAAKRVGVHVAAGSRFGAGPRPSVRLAYSFNTADRLAAAARLLADSWNVPSLSSEWA